MGPILIVAKPYEAEVVRRICADAGYETVISEGEMADCVDRHKPALVILSIRKGEGESPGLEEVLSGGEVPVVLISDTAERPDNVDHVLQRPLEAGHVTACIADALGGTVDDICRRVEGTYTQVLEGDYFTLLGISSSASAGDVQLAYERATRDFNTSRLPPEVAREYARQLEEIHEVLKEAFRILRVDRLREAYREHLNR